MLKMLIPLISLMLAGCWDASADTQANALPDQNGVVVAELFQSQGCSSCPPANAALNKLADRQDVIALSFAVTYWDRLGWKDSFATPEYTQRQRDYNKALRGDGVYTPQVVLNGRKAIVGNGPGELERAIASAGGLPAGPSIGVEGGRVMVGAGKGNGTVWLVRYDPRLHNVAINAGENGGRTLPHRNIVRELTQLGRWSGGKVDFAVPAARDAQYRTVVLVQQGVAGPILAAERI